MNWTRSSKPAGNNSRAHSDRMKYDMDQAKIMRSSNSTSSRRVTNTSTRLPASNVNPASSPSSVYKDAKSKVHASLRGLDQAEDLASNHKYKEAHSTYTKHIETLIKILNDMTSDKSLSSNIGVSKEVLTQRTQSALTDAESIKEKLNAVDARNHSKSSGKTSKSLAKTSNTTSSSKNTSTTRPKDSTLRLFFGGTRSKSTKEVSKNNNISHDHMMIPSSKSADSAHQYNTSQRVSHKGPVGNHPSSSKSQTTRIKPKKRSNLDYQSNDPLITTIKNDIYVDSKTLTTSWNDIAGLETAKRSLQEAAILPLLRPDLYTGLRSPPKVMRFGFLHVQLLCLVLFIF